MSDSNTGVRIGFLGILQIVFVVAKLWGMIEWSWWLVLIPLWVSLGLWVLIMGTAILIALIAAVSAARTRRKRFERRHGGL